ncbi:hypothetical protein BV25DRAFT_421236 [Artomyces pyxidatus]|uniref:Uncharacterized protein n=1 Tax=Artomyces pyxidatus TaxID=48021 RepID=A0ACB8T3P3_9AGAM|nr:hypothetical protein BV25DRAFT_421236 [Artomyces pyxidatus]
MRGAGMVGVYKGYVAESSCQVPFANCARHDLDWASCLRRSFRPPPLSSSPSACFMHARRRPLSFPPVAQVIFSRRAPTRGPARPPCRLRGAPAAAGSPQKCPIHHSPRRRLRISKYHNKYIHSGTAMPPSAPARALPAHLSSWTTGGTSSTAQKSTDRAGTD